ncbi:MAG: hydroxyacylglutathione hydrolase [Gammaproteobacteria bacterium]|nr:hydroxyacylglutathione hydrolase [Gammaproteobacteria bacterium]MCP5423566.1 hydroxyacylglutathione hydrolase [Gammaproteobacteria bacterium]
MLNVAPVRAFQDNYIWLLEDAPGRQAAIVDPGDARPVLEALRKGNVTPTAILITHHHGDHVGGVRGLLAHYPQLPVFGPAGERIPSLTQRLQEGDVITVPGLNVEFRVLDVPGHTAGHIAYYGGGALFCGDTVFSVGCGRLFEGSPEQMHASLSKIAALPGDTLVYCAHEYTLDNIAFAKWVEPENPDLLQREREAHALREQDQPTVPSRLDVERRTNPFLRFDEPTVVAAASAFAGKRLRPGAEVFGTVRYWKDSRFD